MKRMATFGSCLAAMIVLILVGLGASPAAAHGAHRHVPAAASQQTSAGLDRLAASATHAASAIAPLGTSAPDEDGRPQPCQAPCCTGHGCGCCCGFVAWDGGGAFSIAPGAAAGRRPVHDRSRPSLSTEAPSEPPRIFA